MRQLLIALISLVLSAAPGLADFARPNPVSPGGREQITVVSDPCPTFNWAGVEGAVGYDVAVFAAPSGPGETVSGDVGPVPLRPVLRHRIPGAALGWTPPMSRCLQRGGTYGWIVRAVGPEGAGAWSEPFAFRVANLASREEVASALEVLRGYLGEADPAVAAVEAEEQTQPPVLTGLDAEFTPKFLLALGVTGTGTTPPPPPPPPISFFTVDHTGSVFAPTVKANLFLGSGGGLSDVNARFLQGRSPSYFADGTHSHDPWAVCSTCESTPVPGCEELCEVHQPVADGLVSQCFGRVFDSGGPAGPYGAGENALLTLCAPDLLPIYLWFPSFATQDGVDFLHIFDGIGIPANRCTPSQAPASGQTLLGSFTGGTSPNFQLADSGCMALLFCSDGSVEAAGWDAYIGCY